MTSEFNVSEKMTCEEFQDHLPDLIASGEDVSQHPHMLECELCRSLLADLEAIAEAARQLLAPVEDPPDTLWEQIQSKIKAEGPSPSEEEPEVKAADPVKQK
ncbi:anti-sigma factor family protein [Terracidiphilus sp.]|jgi:hypothetical protein|uniref:anti-sigma factor family protein n=1 Tax=Terracidiphilus sp. TaxID=1964191 RepID=UPI003C1B93E0